MGAVMGSKNLKAVIVDDAGAAGIEVVMRQNSKRLPLTSPRAF